MTTLREDAIAMRQMFADAAAAKARGKELNALAKQLEIDFMARCEAEGFDSFKADGTNFVPTETPYANISDRAEFVKWAAENQPELIEYKERSGVMSELLRQHLDDGAPPPPGVDFHTRYYVSKRSA